MLDGEDSNSRVMIVDDTPANLQVLEQILHREGFDVMSFPSGEMALRALKKGKPDLILLDIMMPGISGYDVCSRLKKEREYASIPVIFLSAMSETEDKIRAFREGGVDYITKPFHAEEVIARVGTHINMHRMSLALKQYSEHLQQIIDAQVQEIQESHLATLSAISSLAESRDGITGRHTDRTGLLCRELTLELKRSEVYVDEIDDQFVTDIFHAAPLHDIGKIAISDTILLKPGRLTKEEFETMKTHAAIGAQTLKKVQEKYPNNSFINLGVAIASSHHEKWDGTGYPSGLEGTQIPLCGRIMALVDVYDAVSSRRPYKEAASHEQTVSIIKEGRGSHFDPLIVDAFLEVESDFARIRLENGDDL
ncbi:MAG: response regulator [Sphaerochaetaceae bacterium]|nr:response regulator [Sphaerochaetaceae bacterium]